MSDDRRLRSALALLGGAAALAYLAGEAAGSATLRLVAKPVPVLCLVLWLARRPGKAPALVATGLLACAAGDVLLELPGRFVAGLSAFLLGHVFYTAAFVSARRALAPWRLAGFGLWGASVFAFLYPGLGAMALPVGLYVCVICTMMWRATAALGTPLGISAALGAVLFGLSDTLIAFGRFHAPIAGARYPIMLLYWAGQLGIAAWAHAQAAPPPPGARDSSASRSVAP